MEDIFPEINFGRLKAEVLRWKEWYPCIIQANFYQHRGDRNDADKRYLIDIVAQDGTPLNEIADLEIETNEINESSFFRGLMYAQSGGGVARENWGLYVRLQSDDPPIFLVGEKISLLNIIFPSLKPYIFDELNIQALQDLTAKWAEHYKDLGAVIQSITIHPMAKPISLAEQQPDERVEPKYAVIFHCPDYTRDDLPSVTDSEDEKFEKVMGDNFTPYTQLWCDLQHCKSLFYNRFCMLYRRAEPDDWLAEWRFFMKYSDTEWNKTRGDIIQEYGIVLFPAESNVHIYVVGKSDESVKKDYIQEPNFEKILADICPEVEKFHKDLTKEIEVVGNYKSFAEISDSSELLQIAVDYFEIHKGNYSKLELAHFNDETVFHTHVQRIRRRIIGIILQKYLKKTGIKKPPSIDYLLTVHNKIKT